MRISGKCILNKDVELTELDLKSLPEIQLKKPIIPKSDIRGNGTWWSESDKIRLRQYMNENLKYKTIGRLLGRSRQAVKRRVQRFRKGIP